MCKEGDEVFELAMDDLEQQMEKADKSFVCRIETKNAVHKWTTRSWTGGDMKIFQKISGIDIYEGMRLRWIPVFLINLETNEVQWENYYKLGVIWNPVKCAFLKKKAVDILPEEERAWSEFCKNELQIQGKKFICGMPSMSIRRRKAGEVEDIVAAIRGGEVQAAYWVEKIKNSASYDRKKELDVADKKLLELEVCKMLGHQFHGKQRHGTDWIGVQTLHMTCTGLRKALANTFYIALTGAFGTRYSLLITSL